MVFIFDYHAKIIGINTLRESQILETAEEVKNSAAKLFNSVVTKASA